MTARAPLFVSITFLFCVGVPTLNSSFELFAQSQGTIRGTVIDQSGAGVPFVKVTAFNQATGGIIVTTTTNLSGHFMIRDVPFGQYNVMFEAHGFKQVEHSGIDVTPAQEAHLQIVLFFGAGDSIIGRIKIKVKDKQGHSVSAATIAIIGTNSYVEETGTTDNNGEYIYSAALPGDYSIRAETSAGKRAEKRLRLKKRQTKEIELTLP